MSGQTRKDLISALLKQGVLVSPDMIEQLEAAGTLPTQEVAVLHKDLLSLQDKAVNLKDLEIARALAEKKKDFEAYNAFLSYLHDEQPADDSSVHVAFSYTTPPQKRTPKDFVAYFSRRYEQLEKLLKGRSELSGVVSISRIAPGGKEPIALIGMVREKTLTKNGNIMLTIEDTTGWTKAVITKTKPATFEQAKDLVLDSVIGLIGTAGDKVIFANTVLLPDIPFDHSLKQAPTPGYAAFISDIHCGSAQFLPEEFERFVRWLNGETGSQAQREMARNIKYLFIVGDLVDGVGIYPDQKRELAIVDIFEQYKVCAAYLARIPRRIKLIICPGNHDAMRLSEPQPPFIEDFCAPLRELPNATLVSNPSLVTIHRSEGFPGIDVLLYHGYSFDYYVAEVDSIRNQGGYDRADLIMKFLLQHRHVAPSYGSTLALADPVKDHLVIERVPDIFASGHIHKTSVSNYRNITMICGSCWQSTTSFQEKMGHHPEPARVPIVNLQTREVKVLKFGS